MPWKQKFRPEQLTKETSILFDYNYASMWTRWRRGYELFMYANQALEGINYTFRYAINGQAGSGGTEIPGVCYMYPSTKQDMGMRMTLIRPRDSFNFLDVGIAIKSVSLYDVENQIYEVELSSNFGAPIAFFTGEVVSDRFNPDGTSKNKFNNYTVVGVGVKGVGPNVPNPAPVQNALYLSATPDTSWVTDIGTGFSTPPGPPTPGDFFSTAMRFGCNCPDYLGREDFNLYRYAAKKSYPFTGTEDLKPGIYDAGTATTSGPREEPTRDMPGFARDFGFIYLKRLLGLPEYNDSAESSYSDPNLLYFQPRFCKHIYAAWWDMKNRFEGYDYLQEVLVQPTDEPMDERYREYFYRNLDKQMEVMRQVDNLNWWSKYSPFKDDLPTHMMYSDMFPTVVKVLNFNTLASGTVPNLVASGFSMFDIDTFNPLQPIPPENRPIVDGGGYDDGVVISGGLFTTIYDGGEYLNGSPLPPEFRPLVNGGVY